MKLQSFEILKAKRLAEKTAQEKKARRNAYKLLLELQEELELQLAQNDEVCLEVPEADLLYFLDLLKDDSLSAYSYEQIAPTLFVFKSEDIGY